MPTRNISLTREQDEFVEEIVRSGEYQNASEAIRDGLRALRQKRDEDVLKLKLLRKHIKSGLEALDQGDFVEVDDLNLGDFIANLRGERQKRAS